MFRLFLSLALLFFLFIGNSNAQCPTVSVTLTTQADVNNFMTNYPGCTLLTESLFIDGGGITNLNGLSSIQGSESFITIKNTSLTNLNGLNNCLLYTSPSPRDATLSRMPSSA